MTNGEQIIQRIEEKVRERTRNRRIRVNEFFQDFDKLRSGFVTESQFFRTLWLNLGLKFEPEEEMFMRMKYDLKRNGEMNWKLFADEIEGRFDANDLRTNPMTKTIEPTEYLGTLRSCRPLSPESESRLIPILHRMNQYYNYHAVDIRRQYQDFDSHNIGLVTESQFYRGFPGPSDLTDAEISLLARKYMDPEKVGSVNYMNLHNDLDALRDIDEARKNGVRAENEVPRIPREVTYETSVTQILDRIRMAVHKRGVRTLDFFRDYDKLRHDKVTESQFAAAISLAIGKEANLTRNEVQKMINFFRVDQQYIRYKEMCIALDNPYTFQHLEKNPLLDPDHIWPPTGTLSRGLPILSTAEEHRVEQLLREMRAIVRERRVPMYDYFKDFDHGTGHSGIMTSSQFGRMLHFVGMDVNSEDGKLLARKFADPTSGDVNYAAFIQSVDDNFVAQRVDKEGDDKVIIPPERDWKVLVTPQVKSVGDDVDFETIMSRIRSLVLVHRIRIRQFFEDFDNLRSGRMSESQFRRCIDKIGTSKLMFHDLSDKQANTILNYYRDAEKSDMIHYEQFIRDVDQVFTESELEKQPKKVVLPQEAYVTPKPGTMDWSYADDDLKQICDRALLRMRQKVLERRMLVRPDFQAFDKHRQGHCSQQNFRQLMSMLNMNLTEEEMDAVAARFMDDVGFNYEELLLFIDPPAEPEFGYERRLISLREVNASKPKLEMAPVLLDCEAVMDKIKTIVYRRRVRLGEFFRDFDKLRRGRMPRDTFRRALNMATILLPETEMSLIEDRFAGREPNSVNWMGFVEEIEAVFATKNLEKDPLKDPELFVPPPDYSNNNLTLEEENIVNLAIQKLADKVRQRRMQLHPLFEDFDKNHTMTLSQSQFRRVLTELDLHSMLGEAEWALLFKKFRNPKGSRDDVNYLAFSDEVYAVGGFVHRMP